MARDQTDDPLGCTVLARDLRTATRMVEVAREGGVTGRQTSADTRSEIKKNARDAMPEQGVRGLRRVVQDARDNQFFIGTKMPEDARGLGRMAIVRAARADVASRLPNPMEHARSSIP